jgi:hypothetical protein
MSAVPRKLTCVTPAAQLALIERGELSGDEVEALLDMDAGAGN